MPSTRDFKRLSSCSSAFEQPRLNGSIEIAFHSSQSPIPEPVLRQLWKPKKAVLPTADHMLDLAWGLSQALTWVGCPTIRQTPTF